MLASATCSRAMNRAERRALDAIRYARMMMPGYATGSPIRWSEIGKILEFNHVRVHRANLDTPAFLTPRFGGWHRLYIADWLPQSVVRYIELHECGHCLAGDADEPTVLQFTGPLPEAEEVADLFALSGIISENDVLAAEGMGIEWLETVIRTRVPLDDYGWQTYRIPELAPKVVRMRKLIEEQL
jgi:hypothetical protein